uniref:Uncharacterized protein n=1 Tax=Oryzias latipes TaxID=8090 RepID=A0A3P9HHQ9_ORYLA
FKANALGETGVLAGNSSCSILGDPSKGIYISMYSDCLDQNRWYHGKSGYIAIIRLTKGKVKKVLENYTERFTEPTVGFDCHVSDQLASVSAKTSSFLAFERTQYYIYELLDDTSNRTGVSPAASCPFAIVSFSYNDTKATPFVQQDKRFFSFFPFRFICHYVPWRGKLQIGSKFYNVELRLAARALLPTTLPPVVKVDLASMSDVQRLLPRAVFETPFTDEGVLLKIAQSTKYGFDISTICSICIFFVFVTDTKPVKKGPEVSSDILQILPVLSYAESELEKTPMDQDQKPCEILLEHMQSYATLINPGLATSPSRDVSIFPDQYDVAEAHRHIYSKPEWTCHGWQSLSSYMSKPETFQLPLATVLEILAARQADQREDLDDDVYICLSSPEETQAHHLDLVVEDELKHQQSTVSIEKSLDIGVPNTETHLDITTMPETISQADVTKDITSYKGLTELNQVNLGGSLCPTLEDLPAELIVSITSAEQSMSPKPATNSNNFQFSGFSTGDSFPTVEEKPFGKETEKITKVLDSSEPSERVSASANVMGTKTKRRRGFIKALQNISKPCDDTYDLPVGVTTMEVDSLNYRMEEHTKEMDNPPLRESSKRNWRKFHKRKRIFGKLKKKKARPATEQRTDSGKLNLDGTIFMESEPFSLKRKTERGDLKPIISICGRILVPHGSGQVDDLFKSFNVKPQLAKGENCPDNVLHGDTLKTPNTVEIEQDSDIASLMAVEETKTTKSIPGENHHLSADSSLEQSHWEDIVALTSNTNETSLENDDTNTPLQDTTQEKKMEALSPTKIKEGKVLGKPKTVISKRKPKIGLLETSKKMESTAQDTEPCVKKAKVLSEETKCENASTQETKDGVADIEKMPSLDPSFAFALGLTQKSSLNEDMSVRKTVEKNMNSSCSSTDALNLLADLALSNDQVPPQPNPSIEREPERCNLAKSLTSSEQQSVLHALLKNPAVSSKQALEPSPPAPLMRDSDFVDLVFAEHAYSQPPSSSPLLGLSGTHLGVSTRVLQDQTKQADEDKTLATSAIPEHKPSEYLVTGTQAQRQNFRNSRSVSIKEGSIQVTRQWQEHYDFNLDSKFTSDPKIRVVTRALHGPWNSPIQDNSEEVRLIFHMWIGLFYSRTTARFFTVDSPFMLSCFESYSLKVANEIASSPAKPESKTTSSASFVNLHTSHSMEPKALNLRKDENTILKPEAEILDLSVRSTNSKQFSENTREVEKTEKPKEVCLDHTVTFFERNGTSIFLQKDSGATTQAFSEYGEVKDGSCEDGACMRSFESTQTSEECLKHNKLDLSNPVPNKNGDIVETQDVLCADEHDPLELVLVKTCPMRNNVKQSLQTENCTASDKDIVLDANYLEDEWVSRKGCNSALLKQRNDLNEHVHMEGELHVKDHLRENGLDEKISVISPMEVDQDLKDAKVPQMYNHNPTKEDSIEKYSPQVEVDQQLPLTITPKEDCHNLHENQITLKDKRFVSNSPSSIFSAVQDIHDSKTQESLEEACLPLDVNCMKAPLSVSKERTSSFDESNTDLSDLKSKDVIEAGVQDKVSDVSFDLCSNDQEDQVHGSTDRIGESATPTETFQLQSHSSRSDDKDLCVTGMSKETDLKEDEASEVVHKCNEDALPFFIMGIPEVHAQPQVEVQEPCQGLKTMPHVTGNINSTSVLPSEVCVTSQSCRLKGVDSTQDTLMCDVNEPHKQILLESVFGSRSSTPTVDEKQYEVIPSSASCRKSPVFSGRKSYENTTQKCPGQSLEGLDEQPSEQKIKTSSDNSDSIYKSEILSDINLRTVRVMQTIDRFLLELNPMDMPSQIKTEGMNISLDEKHNSIENFDFTFSTPSHSSGDPKKNKMDPQVVVDSSVSELQYLNKKSSDNNLTSAVKNKTTDVLEIKKHSKRQMSSISKCNFKNVDEYETYLDPDCHFQKSLVSTDSLENGFDSDKPKTSYVDPSCILYQEKEHFKNSLIPLSPSMQFCESPEAPTDFVQESPGVLVQSSKETDDQTTKNVNEKDLTDETQMCCEDDCKQDPSTPSSLVCTVFNTGGKNPYSFLERLSQRCLCEDLTQASMEQECLIFLDQMKNLLKKSKRQQCHQETNDSLRMPCTSPVTIKFSNLDEQEDSFDLLDTSLFGQKIKVDVHKKKDPLVITEEKGKTPDTHNLSQGTRNPTNCSWVSNVTSECAKLYKARMHEVCSAKKVLSKSKTLRVQQSHSDTKHNEKIDFCDKMKKELNKIFQSNLNAVVKKSCKTKNRFFILATSDEQFFEKTKVHLESEGHIAVQPSQFFICEENFTSLFIILKNEDIAEHICKVPHLLKLKMSPDVQFTGIDEPDDVVNLTYQELFTRGGFLLLDKSVLEPLSFCNMKKIFQILQELSRTGKWKWMLHYKDSRRLKENARLSNEAKDMKKHLFWGLDAGILEVLPYHECDLMSKDKPDYLKCLLNLQVQNIAYRFSVFITEEGAFEKNGILTMTLNTFLTKFSSDSF